MTFYSVNKRKISRLVRTLFFASLVFYFSYHAISGERGLLAMMKMGQQVYAAHAEADEVKMERMSLEHKVNMMYSKSLDIDLLDEQARRLLGRANKNEIIYLRPAVK